MQLPPTDELLLVAGVPRVRAKKARYYEDARFRERVLPPPKGNTTKKPATPPADDWSTLAIPATSAGAASDNGNGSAADPANAGIRREPELPEHEEIAPPERPAFNEFDVLDDDPDIDAAKARRLRLQVTSNARQGTMSDAARGSLRMEGGGYRRDHLRAFAQRIEVADQEVRIMGSKSELLRTLTAASGGKSAAFGVRSSILKWRTRHDSNVWPSPSEGDALSS